MYLADYHIHTCYSFDGGKDATVDAMCRAALEKGLSEIAFTDHMDIYTHHPYSYILNCPALYADIRAAQARYAGRLHIAMGAELGQPMNNPAAAARFLSDYPDLDFMIGSIHNMADDTDLYYYNWKKRDPAQFYDGYLDQLLAFARNEDYDVLGHITYPLRYMAEAGIALDVRPYLEKLEALFGAVIARGKGLELNVSGLRQRVQTTLPTPQLLQLYRDVGGEILTIGSDAHGPADLGRYIAVGREIARACGFSAVTVYRRRTPQQVPL